jgi:outer membrane protein OmpA-like peptidoglycan-associated protein
MRRRATAIPGRHLLLRGLAGLASVLFVVGSAAAQDATTLAQAQAALEAARSTRAVRALAAAELDAAEEALGRALAAREAGRPRGEIEHLAYLAERRAAIARMHAKERQSARALEELSATHALISEAQALEAAAAEQRARALAQRLARFDVQADPQGLLLTPRGPWFEAGLAPAPRALRAIAEAAQLLGKLPGRQVVVLGYAVRAAPPHDALASRGAGTEAASQLPALYQEADAAPQMVIQRDDLGCAQADVVRAFLISHGVDPRRIAARCVASPGAHEASTAQMVGPSAGATAIAILPEGVPAWAPSIAGAIDPGPAAPRLSAGAPTEDPPTTTRHRVDW